MNDKLLIADDEPDIVAMLASFFSGKGYRVMTAFNGMETLEKAGQKPDMILLDISMPGLDGLEVCRRIRDHVACPILFLTAKIGDMDKVKGFSAGGDDYMVKPFSLAELEARVSAHLRREARHNTGTRVKFTGDLTVDFAQRGLFYGSGQIVLSKKEFDIVELLSQNPGQVFGKERIYELVWGYDSEGDSWAALPPICANAGCGISGNVIPRQAGWLNVENNVSMENFSAENLSTENVSTGNFPSGARITAFFKSR